MCLQRIIVNFSICIGNIVSCCTVRIGNFAEITTVSNKYTNSFFLNVVEEPEQNLFPESQMKNLAFLLEAANVNDENKIVMTTHSPYVLSYITLAAKTYELMNKGVKCDSAHKTKRTAIGTLLSNEQFAMHNV